MHAADEHNDNAVRHGSDELRQLVVECIERMELEGADVVETICREHPLQADAIRSRLASLHAAGLLDEPHSNDERVPERLGDYRIVRKLGGGGMGVVYLAQQLSLGREVALKLIRPEQLWFPGSRERFRREVEAVARLQHPGIVPVYTVGEAAGIPYFAMEHVDGKSLADVIATLQAKVPGSLSGEDLWRALDVSAEDARQTRDGERLLQGGWVQACLRLVREAAEALEHAHARGVLHRDLKPSNLMLTRAGRVRVVDFGLASTQGADRLTRTGSQLGSLPYMAPEQLRSEHEAIDARTDVYALGVTLYELLALRAPYLGASSEETRALVLAGRAPALRAHNAAVPWDAETVCLKAMERDPARRYVSAAAFAQDLTNVLELRPIAARRPGAALRARRWAQRHPTASVAAALGLLIVLGGPTAISLAIAEQRDAAIAAGDDARREKEVALHQSYSAHVAAAQLSLRTNDIRGARTHLDLCAAALRAWEWRHLNLLADQSVVVLRGLPAPVVLAAFSPDGTRVLAGSHVGTLRVFDVRGPLLHQLGAANAGWTCACFDAAGGVVAGASDGSISCFDAASHLQERLPAVAGDSSAIVCSPDGKRLALIMADGSFMIRERAGGVVLANPAAPPREVPPAIVAFAEDRLVMRESQDVVAVRELSTGALVASLPGQQNTALVALSSDSRKVATAAFDGTIRLWDIAAAPVPGSSIATNMLATNTLATNTIATNTVASSGGLVFALAFSPDAQQLVTGHEDGTVRLWSVATGQSVGVLHGHDKSVTAASFSSDGQWLVSASGDGTARVWDLSWNPELRLLGDGSQRILGTAISPAHSRAVAVSPDGELVAAATWNGTVRLLRLDTGESLRTLIGHQRLVTAVAFTPDGKELCSASDDDTIRVWDVASGEARGVCACAGHRPFALAVSDDGQRVASAGGDCTVRILAREGLHEMQRLQGSEARVLGLRWLADGEHVCCRVAAGGLRIWSMAQGSLVPSPGALLERDPARRLLPQALHAVADGAAADVMASGTRSSPDIALAVSQDGKRIASASMFGVLRLWDAESGEPMFTMPRVRDVNALAFSPDGNHLVVGFAQGSIGVIDAAPPRESLLARRDRIAAERVALPLVERLFDDLVLSDAVVAALRADESLPERARAAALRMAFARGKDPERLVLESRSTVIYADKTPQDYQRAMRQAEAACAAMAPSVAGMSMLGMARCRAGAFAAALEALQRAQQLGGGTATARDGAFAAMALAKLGRIDEAKAALQRAQQQLEEPEGKGDRIGKLFVQQAEQIVDSAHAGPQDK